MEQPYGREVPCSAEGLAFNLQSENNSSVDFGKHHSSHMLLGWDVELEAHTWGKCLKCCGLLSLSLSHLINQPLWATWRGLHNEISTYQPVRGISEWWDGKKKKPPVPGSKLLLKCPTLISWCQFLQKLFVMAMIRMLWFLGDWCFTPSRGTFK